MAKDTAAWLGASLQQETHILIVTSVVVYLYHLSYTLKHGHQSAKRNRNETKRNQRKRNETKRNQQKRNEINEMKTK